MKLPDELSSVRAGGEYSLSIFDQLFATSAAASFEVRQPFVQQVLILGFAGGRATPAYRLRAPDEERRAAVADGAAAFSWFRLPSSARHQPAEKKYRRQSPRTSRRPTGTSTWSVEQVF